MNLSKNQIARFAVGLSLALWAFSATAAAQDKSIVVLSGAELTRVVPTGFYFEGQSAPTQMRNAAAARTGEKKHVIAGLVDTSGYSTEIRAKYEGFLITDSRIKFGEQELPVGAYGFGFTDDGKLNIFDVAGNQILSAATATDKELRRPRPLLMVNAADGLRFYAGRSYAVLGVK